VACHCVALAEAAVRVTTVRQPRGSTSALPALRSSCLERPRRLGSVAHYLGALATVLERYSVAQDHFVAGLAMHEQLEAPFFIARSKLEWGRMLAT